MMCGIATKVAKDIVSTEHIGTVECCERASQQRIQSPTAAPPGKAHIGDLIRRILLDLVEAIAGSDSSPIFRWQNS